MSLTFKSDELSSDAVVDEADVTLLAEATIEEKDGLSEEVSINMEAVNMALQW